MSANDKKKQILFYSVQQVAYQMIVSPEDVLLFDGMEFLAFSLLFIHFVL